MDRIELPLGMPIINALCMAFFAVLFLQSGIDKMIDWKGNLNWLKGHFEKSFLANVVPALFGIITFTELLAGVASAVGIVEVLFYASNVIASFALLFCLFNILVLFTGQRIAKDYEGAAVLVNYFLLGIVSLVLLG